MQVKLDLLITSTENQTRPQMYDVRHADTIEQSLINTDDVMAAIKKLPPLLVEETMGDDKFKVIDGHHRLEVLRRLSNQYPIETVDIEVSKPKTTYQKILQGFDANCSDTPAKNAGMAELEIALSKLHGEGININDEDLQDHFKRKLNHKTKAQVARIANRITTVVDPVEVVSSRAIDEFHEDNEDAHTVVNHTQSTKWQQGLGYLLERMAEEDKEQGLLLIYFADGLKKKRYDCGKILRVINTFDLSIKIQYLN